LWNEVPFVGYGALEEALCERAEFFRVFLVPWDDATIKRAVP
jgi:hypothetical protein